MSPAGRWQEADRTLDQVPAPITPPLNLWPHRPEIQGRDDRETQTNQGRGDHTSSSSPSWAHAERGAAWQPAEDLPGLPAPGLCWGNMNSVDGRSAECRDPSTEAIEGRAAPEVYTVPVSILSFAEHESDEEDTGVDAKKRRRNSHTRIVSRIYDADLDQERPATPSQREKMSCPSWPKRPAAGSGRCEDSRKRRRSTTKSVSTTTNWCTQQDCDASLPAVIHH